MDFIFQQRPLEIYEEFIDQVNQIYRHLKKSENLIQQLQSIEAEFFQQNLPKVQIYKLFLIIFVNFENTQDENQTNRSIHQFFEGKHQRVDLIIKFFFKVFQYFDIIQKEHHIIFIIIFENFIPLIEHDNSFFELVCEFITNYMSYQSEFCFSQKIQNLLYQKIYQNPTSNQNIKNIIAAKFFQIQLFQLIKGNNNQEQYFSQIFQNEQQKHYFQQLGSESFFLFKLIQDKIDFASLYRNFEEVRTKQDQYSCLTFYKLIIPIKIQKFVVFFFQQGTQESYSYQMNWFQKQILQSIQDFDYYFYIFLIRYIYYQSLYSVTHDTQIRPWVLIMQTVQIVASCEQKNLYSLAKEAILLDWLFYDHKIDLQKPFVKISFDTMIQMNQYNLQQQSNDLIEFLFLLMKQYDQSEKIADVFIYLEYLNYDLAVIIQHLNVEEEIRTELFGIYEKIQKRQNFLKKEDIFEDQKDNQIDPFEESFDESIDQTQNKVQIETLNFYTSRQDLQFYLTQQDFLNLVVQGKNNTQILDCISKSVLSDFYGFQDFDIKKIKDLLIYQLFYLDVRIGRIDKGYQQKFTLIIKNLLKNKEVLQVCLIVFVLNYKTEKEKQITGLQKTAIKVNKKFIDQSLLDSIVEFMIEKIKPEEHLKYSLVLLKLIKNFNLTKHYFFAVSLCYQFSKYSQDLFDVEEMTFYFVKKYEELNFQENQYMFKIFCQTFIENQILFPSKDFDQSLQKIVVYINQNPQFLRNNCLMITKGLKYIQQSLNLEDQQNCLKSLFELQYECLWYFKIISQIFQKNQIMHLIKSKSKTLQQTQKVNFINTLSQSIQFNDEERELLLQDSSLNAINQFL